MHKNNQKSGIECFCPHCGNKIVITIENSGKVGGTLSGAISGAIIGSKFGIAGGPLGAIAGTIPGFFLGALLGESVGAKIDDPTCLNCNTSFKIPQKSISAFKELNIAQTESKYEHSQEEFLIVIENYSNYYFSFAKENFRDVYRKYSLFRDDSEFSSTDFYKKYKSFYKPTSFSDLKKKFSSVIQLFGMYEDYITVFEKEISTDVAENDFNLHQYSAFLNSFKTNFYGQINNRKNIIVSKVFDINRNTDLYLEVLKHFLLTFYEIMLWDKFFEYHSSNFTDHKDFIQKYIVDSSNEREKSRLELVKKFPYEIDWSDIRT